MSKLECLQVNKSFYNNPGVLKNISFMIQDGEFVSIVGPSGCGKSTLLRIIAGLTKNDTGDLILDGKDLANVKAGERNISMVFQNYALFPSMNIYDNIAFTLKNRKVSKSEIKKEVNYIAKKLEIEQLLDRLPKGLSGGEAQRVSIARAIISKPSLLLMDEPLANLDTINKNNIKALIKNIQKENKLTTIYVTHDPIEAMTLSDRIMILKNGEIQQFDTPINCYKNPSNVFVGEFIGDLPMNFLKINPIKEKNSFYVDDQGPFDFNNILKTVPENISDKELLLGIRTDGIRIDEKDLADEGLIKLKAKITSIDNLGSRSYAYCKVSDSNVLVETNLEKELSEEVNLFLKTRDIRIFDKKDGQRIKER